MEEIKIPWADWKIEERIGKGGFGMVYKIRHRDEFNVEEYAAMKIIRFPQDDHENAVLLSEGYDKDSIIAYNRERLDKVINEYAIMMKMKGHRNIVRCDDCKAVPHEDGMGWDVFIRMELLTPLHTRLANGEMSETDVVQLGKDLCQALILCEREKIVHRDIKPENIFVNDYGDYKLGDFGISRTLEHTTNATRTGSLKFMAPEVYKGQKYGTTVDIYSLGLVMYWLLNNRRMPFTPLNHPATVHENMEAMRRRLDGAEPIPTPANGGDALKKIVVKACSFNPEERYSSAEELYNELHSLAFKEGTQRKKDFNKTITEENTEDESTLEEDCNTVVETEEKLKGETDHNYVKTTKSNYIKIAVAIIVSALAIPLILYLLLGGNSVNDGGDTVNVRVDNDLMIKEISATYGVKYVNSDTYKGYMCSCITTDDEEVWVYFTSRLYMNEINSNVERSILNDVPSSETHTFEQAKSIERELVSLNDVVLPMKGNNELRDLIGNSKVFKAIKVD